MSKILVARTPDLGFIKVIGRGSFQNSGCLKAFYQQLLKEGVHRFVVDLGSCTYLDSTFLGVLLGLGLTLKHGEHGRLHVLNASVRNVELLKNLGLDRVIHIDGLASTDPAGAGAGPNNGVEGGHGASAARPVNLNGINEEHLEEVACPTPSRQEAAPTILEAHEALMEFDPRNVPKFKDVVEFLREDLGQPAAKN